jgi:long-chain fatty acid transport protein
MNMAIKPINFQPTVAYRFDDWNLAVAAGLDVTHAIVTMQSSPYSPVIDPTKPAAPYGAYELGNMGVDATATDVGYNLGLLWKPRKDLSFGIAYRSEISLHLKGDANFLATTPTGLGVIGYSSTAVFPFTRARATSSASATITLPDSLALGVAWMPTEKLTLEFDAERTGWSSMKQLDIKFNSPQFSSLNNRPKPWNWEDVWCYKFGGQYALTKNIDLRAGYMYDMNPIPDSTLGPMLPDANRHSFSIGQGFHTEMFSLDLAYMLTHFEDRTVNNQDPMTLLGQNGTFKSNVHLFGGSITVKF